MKNKSPKTSRNNSNPPTEVSDTSKRDEAGRGEPPPNDPTSLASESASLLPTISYVTVVVVVAIGYLYMGGYFSALGVEHELFQRSIPRYVFNAFLAITFPARNSPFGGTWDPIVQVLWMMLFSVVIFLPRIASICLKKFAHE
jgi:hypothetical protein